MSPKYIMSPFWTMLACIFLAILKPRSVTMTTVDQQTNFNKQSYNDNSTNGTDTSSDILSSSTLDMTSPPEMSTESEYVALSSSRSPLPSHDTASSSSQPAYYDERHQNQTNYHSPITVEVESLKITEENEYVHVSWSVGHLDPDSIIGFVISYDINNNHDENVDDDSVFSTDLPSHATNFDLHLPAGDFIHVCVYAKVKAKSSNEVDDMTQFDDVGDSCAIIKDWIEKEPLSPYRYVTGILASTVVLIPSIYVIIYIMRKDRKLRENKEEDETPLVTTKGLSNEAFVKEVMPESEASKQHQHNVTLSLQVPSLTGKRADVESKNSITIVNETRGIPVEKDNGGKVESESINSQGVKRDNDSDGYDVSKNGSSDAINVKF